MIFKSELQARIFALALLVLVEYAAAIVMPMAPRNDWYFIVAALFNFVTLLVLTATERRPLMLALSKLTFVQFVIQFIGWALYVISVPALFYNIGIHVIVLVTFLRILWIGKDDRDYADDPDRAMVFSHPRLWASKAFGVPK